MGEVINVEDFDYYLENDEFIKSRLNLACNDFSDLLSNVSTLEYNTSIIGDKLSGYGIENLQNLVDTATELKEYTDIAVTYLGEQALKIFGALPKFEAEIIRLNRDGSYDMGMFDPNIDLEEQSAEWIAEGLKELKDKNAIFGGIGFIINYAFNGSHNKSLEDYLCSGYDGVSNYMLSKIQSWLESTGLKDVSQFWVNASIGSVAVAIGVTLRDLLSDEGDWTNLDTERLLFDIASAVGNTMTATAVTAGFSSILGETLGAAAGPIGVVVGAIAGYFVGYGIDCLAAEITGDVAIDKFVVIENQDGTEEVKAWSEELVDELNNNQIKYGVYEVPRNGNGENGTFDVLLERAEKEHDKSNDVYTLPDGSVWSYRNYKEALYSILSNDGLETALTRNGTYNRQMSAEYGCSYEQLFNSRFNSLLSKEYNSRDEFMKDYYELFYRNPYQNYNAELSEGVYEDGGSAKFLSSVFKYNVLEQYEFDPWEYYLYRTTGSII